MKWFEGPILSIETSCDETSAAIVLQNQILSNVVSSQVELHAKWGGIVPEAAARAHVEAIVPIIAEALESAQLRLHDVSAIAVTNRPGLIGALSVGLSAAKSLALALHVPLIGIHHLEGHIVSPWVGLDRIQSHSCLIVSGGHTELVHVQEFGAYRVIGVTLDDAAGEAFDKGARLLGLGYPGGAAIQQGASDGNPERYSLPRATLRNRFDFSFSGLKTAMLRLVENEGASIHIADACASLQAAIVEPLVEKSISAAEEMGSNVLTIVGGVSANLSLREAANAAGNQAGIKVMFAPISLCTDNAGMIGLAAAYRLGRGEFDSWELDCFANSDIPGCVK